MYFGLSEDQIFFQDNVKKFLEDETETIVEDMGEELNRVDADRAGGGF